MNSANPNELSFKNAESSKQGVINNDMVPSERPIAADRALKSIVSCGRIKQDGTVNLDSILGRSRFDRK